MSPDPENPLLRRLHSATGHLQAVTGMVEADAPCQQVLHQLRAVQAALCAVGCLLIEEQIQNSLAVIEQSDSSQDRTQAAEQLVLLHQMMTK